METRLRGIGRLIALAMLATLSGSALAQAWPAKPMRIVVPFAAGGASDVLARLVGQKLSERLGQPVVVENKPGATTTLGASEVAKAPADGYTLMLAPAPFVIAPLMYQKLTYDTAKDFTGVALLASSPLILTVHPSVGVSTPQELLALGKAKPGAVAYGSPGSGSVPHLATELFKLRTGTDFTHVPYKGGGPAVTDLVAGHIGMMFASPIEVSQHVAAGKLKYLVTSTKDRVPSLPNVPTAGEVGIAGFDVVAWFGIVAPAATPRDVVGRLSQEIGRILAASDVKEKFAAQGAEITYLPADEFDRFLAREREQWAQAVKVSGAKLD
ncbi:MAG: tripartite tricarboxylate transporter substrate binding protein [Betaproteobacteria bacterium]|jgi:tripartite-type tricarboxylate transporter receptor subunit TctC|nr:tripartite tricarboxylate transporter substrate binding protein [Betaproteobacteria bacterium]MDH5286341.1 tripartite tricarboxylate transporter substrate binding protein [Betaproteobacteria bacterium]